MLTNMTLGEVYKSSLYYLLFFSLHLRFFKLKRKKVQKIKQNCFFFILLRSNLYCLGVISSSGWQMYDFNNYLFKKYIYKNAFFHMYISQKGKTYDEEYKNTFKEKLLYTC